VHHTLRVVTWNLWGRYGPWLERAPAITAELRRLAPDVVCLQEVWTADGRTQADELAEDLGMHATFDRTRMPDVEPGSGADALGMAVLGRWPVLGRRRSELPTALPGDPSSLVVVTFAHPSGPLHVATTVPVWEQDAGAVRVAQTTAVAAALTSAELDGVPPVVLGADLNARPGTPEFDVLSEALVDAWAAVRAGDPGVTFAHANRWVPAGEWLADGRIDHVLVRSGSAGHPVSVVAAELAGTGDPPPSDHYAVVVDLAWSDDAPRT
jgi:endonuclease/exonuclease/phosphatase family metal-dependent hydrolase